MEPRQAIQKATLLLDLKHDADKAEQTLRESLAQYPDLTPARIQAHILLGDLLLSLGRQEGEKELQDALAAAATRPEWDDVLGEDVARARRVLGAKSRA